jgi:hypothetical protein
VLTAAHLIATRVHVCLKDDQNCSTHGDLAPWFLIVPIVLALVAYVWWYWKFQRRR